MCAAAGVDVGVVVGVGVRVGVNVGVRVGGGVNVGVMVKVKVRVGVAVRRSGSTIVWVSEIDPDAVCTVAWMVTTDPCSAWLYLMHESASPGWGTTVNPSVHPAA